MISAAKFKIGDEVYVANWPGIFCVTDLYLSKQDYWIYSLRYAGVFGYRLVEAAEENLTLRNPLETLSEI